jgi:LuxR family maltose regulon positive regulatory protein
VYLALSMGDLQRAEERIESMEARPMRPYDLAFVHRLRSGLALLHGDFALAEREARACLDMTERAGTPFQSAFARIGLAQALIERNEQAAAREQLAQIKRFAAEAQALAFAFWSGLAESHSWLREGDEAKAQAVLRAALVIGRSHDYMNAHPYWLPQVMSRLCAFALERGIEPEYVTRLIKRRGLVAPSPEAVDWPFPVKIYTLGRLSVIIDGKPLQFKGKAQRKPLELLMALVAFGGRDVSEAQLTEALWPDSEGGAAHEACAIALHRLRKLLGYERAISLQRNQFSLDPSYVWVDVWAFERWLGSAQDKLDVAGRRASERAMGLYQGPFLGKHLDLSWAVSPRERLRAKFLRHLTRWADGLLQAQEFGPAVIVLEAGLNVDPLAEEFYRQLMRCYRALDRRAEAIGVFQRCQKTLAATLGVSPGAETLALYQSFQR